MKIIDMLRQEKPSLSFEVFPPKAADKYDSVEAAAAEIAKLKPSFMSITYGAGGGTSQYTVDIASTIQNTYHVNALAHLTCVSSTREHVRGVLDLSLIHIYFWFRPATTWLSTPPQQAAFP